MTTIVRPTAAPAATTDPTRGHARAAGIFYLVTFAASMPALALLGPVLHHPDYIVSNGADTRVLWGCFLDFVNALAGIGSAIAVYPVMKRFGESRALGFVTSRLVEAAVIMIGVVSLLAVVTVRQDFGGPHAADPAGLSAIGHFLVALRDWTFLLGPGTMPAISAVLFGTLMYKSRMVPRFIPTMGLVGAPLLLGANIATFFGHNEQLSTASALATLPVAAWELSIGLWMTFKGFKQNGAEEAAL